MSATFISNMQRLLTILVAVSLVLTASGRSEVFGVSAGQANESYFVGYNGSKFLVGRKDFDSFGCGKTVASTAGSLDIVASDSDPAQALRGVLFDSQRSLLFAVGTARVDFETRSQTRDRNVAVLVYHNDLTLSDISPLSYYVSSNLDNVAVSTNFGPGGDLLVASYGALPNARNFKFESHLLQLDSRDLSVIADHDLGAGLLTSFHGTGPKVSDFVYEKATNSVICVGSVVGAGILWRYDLTSRRATGVMEFNNFQASGGATTIISKKIGEYFVTGSSSSAVLLNANKDFDAEFEHRSEIHAYVARIEAAGAGFKARWSRQIGSLGRQSGRDLTFDPKTGGIAAVGTFDRSFSYTDTLTGIMHTVNAFGEDASADVFLWILNALGGKTEDLFLAKDASTAKDDAANAVLINSAGGFEIGGSLYTILNQPGICFQKNLQASSHPSRTRKMKRNPEKYLAALPQGPRSSALSKESVLAIDGKEPRNGKTKRTQSRQRVLPGKKKSLEMVASQSKGSKANNARPFTPGRLLSTKTKLTTFKGRKYGILETLGVGASGKVFKVLSPERRNFALKIVEVDVLKRPMLLRFAKEVSLLKRLRGCSRIVHLEEFEVDLKAGTVKLLLELGEIDFGHLLKNIFAENRMTAALRRTFWYQMVQGVDMVHEHRVIHGDLKPMNFIQANGKLKVIDFGLAAELENWKDYVFYAGHIGTVGYMAPEIVVPYKFAEESRGARTRKNRLLARHHRAKNSAPSPRFRVSRASDVWSLGCILYQMVYRVSPYAHLKDKKDKILHLKNDGYEIAFPITNDTNPVILDVLRGCLDRDPEKRMTTAELMGHPYLTSRTIF